jgi:hypothetical protein
VWKDDPLSISRVTASSILQIAHLFMHPFDSIANMHHIMLVVTIDHTREDLSHEALL